jgi:hypothetical protein
MNKLKRIKMLKEHPSKMQIFDRANLNQCNRRNLNREKILVLQFCSGLFLQDWKYYRLANQQGDSCTWVLLDCRKAAKFNFFSGLEYDTYFKPVPSTHQNWKVSEIAVKLSM